MENLRGEYSKRKQAIKARLQDFSKIKEEDYFYEMCFCICTPQSSALKSDKAVKSLIENDFKNKKLEPSKHLVKAVIHAESAFNTTTGMQKVTLIGLCLLLILAALGNWHVTLVALIAGITVFYFLDLLLSFLIVLKVRSW